MKQVVQNVGTGKLEVLDVPEPLVRPGYVLIANERSLLSPGTEKAALDLGRKSLLGKARERPDHLRRVLQKVKQEGLLTTWRQVQQRLDEPMAMGYASAGVVLACGAGVQSLKPGDRVASNGPHAEIVCVPENLCALVPDGVSMDHAAFTVLGAIALQGVRLARLELGEVAFVVGLGVVGQMAVGLLAAMGCRVIATDLDESRCQLALAMGAAEARPGLSAAEVASTTRGLGADAVLIAAATKSSAPVTLAVDAVRKKGRVVLLGVADLTFDRRPLFFKEAEFVVSCSYGPGRYDPRYEEQGSDYPAPYVRWTEQRNLQAVLDQMGTGRLDVAPLISHRFPIADAEQAYALIADGAEPFVGVLLEHAPPTERRRTLELRASAGTGRVGVGGLGAGQFARSVLLPAVAKAPDVRLRLLSSAGGLSATHTGRKLGFEVVTTDEASVLSDAEVDAVFVLTRHDQHARQTVSALEAGKHVFVEKPLAMTVDELRGVEAARAQAPDRVLMVGFNRRFAPATRLVRDHFEGVSDPLTVSIRFNAGAIPPEHWTQDQEIGGGRIVGEACHAIDLATYFAGAPPVRVFAEAIGGPSAPQITEDQCFLTLRHANGAISSVAYLAGGTSAFPKERVEVFGGGRVAVIDDWSRVELAPGSRGSVTTTRVRGKGHAEGVSAFLEAVRKGGGSPIPWEEIRAVTLASLLAVQSLHEGGPLALSAADADAVRD